MDDARMTQESVERQIQAFEEFASASSTISKTACAVAGGAIVGALDVGNNVNQDTKYIECIVGGAGLGAFTVWGKLHISTDVNHAGYTGPCQVTMGGFLASYLHIFGFDNSSNKVFYFVGGGLGVGGFNGGGRYEVMNPVT